MALLSDCDFPFRCGPTSRVFRLVGSFIGGVMPTEQEQRWRNFSSRPQFNRLTNQQKDELIAMWLIARKGKTAAIKLIEKLDDFNNCPRKLYTINGDTQPHWYNKDGTPYDGKGAAYDAYGRKD